MNEAAVLTRLLFYIHHLPAFLQIHLIGFKKNGLKKLNGNVETIILKGMTARYGALPPKESYMGVTRLVVSSPIIDVFIY